MAADDEGRLLDYSGFLRRQWPVLLMGLGAGLMLSLLAIVLAPPTYESTTSVLVRPTSQDTNVSGGRTAEEINLDTEAQIVTSSVVATLANADLTDKNLRSGLSNRELAQRVNVTVPANTSVLNITFSAGTPEGAQAGAESFAESYLQNRQSLAEERTNARIETLQDSIESDNDRLSELDEQIAAGGGDALQTQRELLVQQIRSNSNSLSPLLTETVQPGDVITEAPLPQRPAGLSETLLIASGIVAGIMLGLVVALVRDQRDTRVRSRRDLERLGLDVLVPPFALPPSSQITSPHGANDEQLRRLRNALLARLDRHQGSFVVAAASPDKAGATLAASLAITLARSGVNTAYVCCNTEYDVVPEAFGEFPPVTLADVLRAGTPVEQTLYPVRGISRLLVVPAGTDGSLFSELLQDPAVRPVLAAIEDRVDVVVLDVASTASNADAQTLANATQGVVLVVDEGTSTSEEVLEAVDQMHHVRAPVLGSVLVSLTEEEDAPGSERRQRRRGRRPRRKPDEA